jgi:hypothetical protein
MPQKPIKAITFAVILWLIGLVWGSIIFMLPSLKTTAPNPFISSNPWISFPLLLMWLPASYLFAGNYQRSVRNPDGEGLKPGWLFSLMNAVLNILVLAVIFENGLQYFALLTVFFGYGLLLLMPWWAARFLTSDYFRSGARS